MRRTVLFSILGMLLGAGAFGCRSDVKKVNDAAIVRSSYSDDASRQVAEFSIRKFEAQRGTDYRLGAGDVIEVSIFEWELSEETKTATFRVAESGIVSLPVIGELPVSGRSVREVKRMVEDRLREGGYIKQPRVTVDVREFRSKRVSVVGAVRDPGVYVMRENVTTLLDVLSLAGGVSDSAGFRLRVVQSKRPLSEAAVTLEDEGETATVTFGQPDRPASPENGAPPLERNVVTIDLYDLLERGNMDLNMAIEDGYLIHVPTAERFAVIGHVRRPGNFQLTRPTTILEGVAMAEGLMERQASPRHCTLKRRVEGEVKVLPVDLLKIAEGEAPNIYLMPDDVLNVRQTFAKNVLLETLDAMKGLIGFGYSLNR